jgi:transglutaminase-like putative cysteine protease
VLSDKLQNKGKFLLLLGLMFGLALGVFFWLKPNRDMAQPVEKTLRFTYTLSNTSGELIPQAHFIAMIPLEIEGAQHIESVVATDTYEFVPQKDMSKSLQFTLKNFPPYATKIISITVKLTLDAVAKEDFMVRNQYLHTQDYIETHSAAVTSLATPLKNKKSYLGAKATYEWLVNNIADAGYVSDNKGAQYALEKRTGDCTEHMYAFVALARANKIPARGLAGFVVPHAAGILNSADYHNWAEFFDGKKWILVDSQKKVFDAQYQDYVVTRVLGTEDDSALPASRFVMTDARIKVSL